MIAFRSVRASINLSGTLMVWQNLGLCDEVLCELPSDPLTSANFQAVDHLEGGFLMRPKDLLSLPLRLSLFPEQNHQPSLIYSRVNSSPGLPQPVGNPPYDSPRPGGWVCRSVLLHVISRQIETRALGVAAADVLIQSDRLSFFSAEVGCLRRTNLWPQSC